MGTSRPVSRLKIKIFGLLGDEATGSAAIGGLVGIVLILLRTAAMAGLSASAAMPELSAFAFNPSGTIAASTLLLR
jgi:hypothetical protein